MGDIFKDNRFAKYLNDPRYRQIPKHERKVKIDKRFESMFNDEKFRVKYTIDKRGRPVNETSTENLRKYYELDESEDDSSEDEEATKKESSEKEDNSEGEADTSGRFVRRPSSGEDAVVPKLTNDKLERGKLDKKTKKRLLDLDIDYARGEGFLQTDSSSDDDTSEEEEDSELEHEWGELDADAGTTEEATSRIALCNMDWDNIKAVDIMVLLSSFLPPGGVIKDVTIYPSEFGLQRMREEEVRGPPELTEARADDDHAEENEEGSSYHMEKLRRYQLARLRYFYAVVSCGSAAAAERLYAECDGMEWESSATRLDMRFVPDDVTFDQEPREVCSHLPDPSKYKPRLFTTTALQQAKVELTWDATNPQRTDAIRSALAGGVDDLALDEYLASSTDGSDDEETDKPAAELVSERDDDPIQKYKSLLQEIEQKEDKKKNKDMELEITWGLGVKDKADELKKKIQEENKVLTPFEQLMEKKREKKRKKKLEKKQKLDEQPQSDSEEDVPSDVDMNDPYFAEEFNKPEFKKSKKTKKANKETEDSPDEEEERRKAELELLLDDEDDGKAHFSLKKIQEAEGDSKKSKRRKKLKQKMAEEKQALPDFEVDVNDERFAALYNSHLYNIDPSDPNFKKTKNMEKIIQEKLKRRPADAPADPAPKRSREDAEMSLLVKNIKRKTKSAMKK